MQQQRNDKVMPRIFRTWNPRTGRMVWQCNALPEGKWGMGVSMQTRYDWRQAQMWCIQKNKSGENNGIS